MKTKLFFLSLCMMFVGIAFAQETPSNPVTTVDFETKVHDFGVIPEEGGKVTTTFVFKNTGKKNFVITKVQASCGCTTPDWSKEPIAPGKKGYVKATYNPAGRPGNFSKSITVTSNAGTVVLNIKGQVTPKPKAEEK